MTKSRKTKRKPRVLWIALERGPLDNESEYVASPKKKDASDATILSSNDERQYEFVEFREVLK